MAQNGNMKHMEEHEITLTMHADRPLAREVLEELTMKAQLVLDAQAKNLALGAAASANFVENSIELDFVVLASSDSHVHDRIADVIRILEGAGFAKAQNPVEREDPVEQFTLATSYAHAVHHAYA